MDAQRAEAAYAGNLPGFRQGVSRRAADAQHFGRLADGYQAH